MCSVGAFVWAVCMLVVLCGKVGFESADNGSAAVAKGQGAVVFWGVDMLECRAVGFLDSWAGERVLAPC